MNCQIFSRRTIFQRVLCVGFFASLLSTVTISTSGCQSVLFTAAYIIKGTDAPPKYDIFNKKKGPMKAAVVCRSMGGNPMEIQNAPAKISQLVSMHLATKAKNKKLEMIEQTKVEEWIDNCNNEYESFREIGLDESIAADIIIGIDLLDFQIRDPNSPYLLQGRASVQVWAIDVATGNTLANETLMIQDPPNVPINAGPGSETVFRPQFYNVMAAQIAQLFHPHDPNKSRRIDADNLEMLQYN